MQTTNNSKQSDHQTKIEATAQQKKRKEYETKQNETKQNETK
jgi:hypothetical protein